MSFIDWFMMHGYAAYVWPAYGLAFVVLGANLISSRLQRKRLLKSWNS